MARNLNDSLAKITKGAGIALIGSLASLLFAFIGRVMIARIGTEADYGVFSLALAVLSICAVISTLGLRDGLARAIAHARGKKDNLRVQKLIPASIQFSLLTSLLVGTIIFFTSDILSGQVFHDAALALPLKVFAVGVPFFTMLYVLVSIFRGFDDIKPTVYFDNILNNLLFPVFLLPLIFFSLPISGVYYAFLASLVISCIALIVYAVKRLPSPVKIVSKAIAGPIAKELLVFSLPLLGVAILALLVTWTDTLMIGGFRTSAEVGLYNAAYPLAHFISTPLRAILLIYMPVTSGLYAQGLIPEIRRNFSILTKWLCAATLPLFLILFLFPETVLNFLFGASYAPAATALRILSLGSIINNFLGPNGATLIAMGRVRFIMWATLATTLLNVGLNFALIPPLGIEGAAIASIAAMISINLIRCWKLHSISGAQPLSKNLIKPILASLAAVVLIYFVATSFLTITLWMLPLLFILCYVIYGLAVLFTKSFDKEDIAMLLAIEKRAGLNLAPLKRFLRRFL